MEPVTSGNRRRVSQLLESTLATQGQTGRWSQAEPVAPQLVYKKTGAVPQASQQTMPPALARCIRFSVPGPTDWRWAGYPMFSTPTGVFLPRSSAGYATSPGAGSRLGQRIRAGLPGRAVAVHTGCDLCVGRLLPEIQNTQRHTVPHPP